MTTLRDCALAIAIGVLMALAVASWATEPEPVVAGETR
jgi:hypothetical protein